jgi:hypothetical protein
VTAPPETSFDSAAWQKAADAALASYIAARARAEGWDDDGVALTLAWLPRRAPDTPLLVTDRRIEMDLHGEVHLVIRRFVCADYEPAPCSIRCRSFVAGGGCSRPDHPVCIEWQRISARP